MAVPFIISAPIPMAAQRKVVSFSSSVVPGYSFLNALLIRFDIFICILSFTNAN